MCRKLRHVLASDANPVDDVTGAADGPAGSGTGTNVEAVKTDAGKLPGCSRSTSGNRWVNG
ncbi:hypothetical protein ASD02_25685 [Ensifer sp. Root1252]|nr:hypothetical protein ASD02_25685 [Ensifer sp. Root1252]KQW72596.1 hypothetical protein ASD03_31510 [Ensifer sp. Root127]KRC79405.1 hypothetical protein ASE32_26215 [Ensifer sp. Root231]KRC99798.1 hypothetical protein ASE47_26580 [Ensifer sp. Root258]